MIKAIFLDRDGVINKDPGGGWTKKYEYVTELKDFIFLPGALEALKLLNQNRVKVIIVSNQAGVAKGYFTHKRLEEITCMMVDAVKRSGGAIADVYYCTHKNEDDCACRKPKPGMLEAAIEKYNIIPRQTYFIGDSKVDTLAGKAVGLNTIFVQSGKTGSDEVRKWEVKPDYIFPDLLQAVKWVLAKERRKTDRSFKREKEDKRR